MKRYESRRFPPRVECPKQIAIANLVQTADQPHNYRACLLATSLCCLAVVRTSDVRHYEMLVGVWGVQLALEIAAVWLTRTHKCSFLLTIRNRMYAKDLAARTMCPEPNAARRTIVSRALNAPQKNCLRPRRSRSLRKSPPL